MVASRLYTRPCSPDRNPSTLGFPKANIPHKSIGLSQRMMCAVTHKSCVMIVEDTSVRTAEESQKNPSRLGFLRRRLPHRSKIAEGAGGPEYLRVEK